MRFRIKSFIFCDQQQSLINQESLSDESSVVQLEPMVAELLAYFCSHTHQVVSRDDLIENVWNGRIVSENAISKTITKLRQALNDDAKKPEFIVTLPKKGYRFIVEPEPVNEPVVSPSETTTVHTNTSFKRFNSATRLFSVVAIVAFIGVLVFRPYIDSSSPVLTEVKAVTRDNGIERAPRLSPDGVSLAYIQLHEGKMRLWIKSLLDESKIEVSHGHSDQVWVGPASWNSTGDTFVYLVTENGKCAYYRRTFNQMTISEPTLIRRCADGSAGKIEFTHDDDVLIFSEAMAHGQPYTLYQLTMSTGETKRLNQPEQFIGGNSQFDLHPFENKLLISSPDKQQWEGFYQLDLDNDELTLLFKLDAYICCGIWDHSGERVVLMGEHPSNQLLSYSKKGDDVKVIYSGSHQLRVPTRHPNGTDYYFVSVDLNSDIVFFDFQSQQQNPLVESSVNDRLATINNKGDQFAFVSESTGNEEIWLYTLDNRSRKKISSFADSRHYIQLLWTRDDNQLLAMKLNEIHLIDSKTGIAKTLNIPQTELRSLSVKNETTIAFSMQNESGWRVFNYDLTTDEMTIESEPWQYASYGKTPDDNLRVDQYQKLFVGEPAARLSKPELDNLAKDVSRIFPIQKSGSIWSWAQFYKGKIKISVQSETDPNIDFFVLSQSRHHSLTEQGVLFEKQMTRSSDIYRTTHGK